VSDLANGAVDAVVGVDEDIPAPDPLGDLLPCDKLRAALTRKSRISMGSAPA
jgi:hypothetical protein